MSYKSDLISCISYSLRFTFIIFIFLPIKILFLRFLFYCFFAIIFFIIIYFFCRVELFHNFLVIRILSFKITYNLNDYYCRRYFYFRFYANNIKVYSTFFIKRPLYFRYDDSIYPKRIVFLDFLSESDYFDIYKRIKHLKESNESSDFKKINIYDYNFNIDSGRIVNILNRVNRQNKNIIVVMFVFSLLLSILFIICYSFLDFNLLYDVIFLFMLCMFSFIIYNFRRISLYFRFKSLQKIVAHHISIGSNMVVDDDIFVYDDVTNIYINSYFDYIGNEVKILNICYKGINYKYCLDYIVDGDINFDYFENMCDAFKSVFGVLFSKNDL